MCIRDSTTTLRTGNSTIDTCFDADRLDLERVGIIPYPNKMATSKGDVYKRQLEVTMQHLKEDCITPVFAKDNELTIPHPAFIDTRCV